MKCGNKADTKRLDVSVRSPDEEIAMTEGLVVPENAERAFDLLNQLRDLGFAVAAFTPEELRGADSGHVEDVMVERGCNAIDTLADRGIDREGGE
jgi:hypothetical protein